jgi:hypothetical protein
MMVFVLKYKMFFIAGFAFFILGLVLAFFHTSKNLRYDKKSIEEFREVKEAQNKAFTDRLDKMKREEINVIENLNNEKVKINYLPCDSLQFYADSLYGAKFKR